jgi:hypothetical protein
MQQRYLEFISLFPIHFVDPAARAVYEAHVEIKKFGGKADDQAVAYMLLDAQNFLFFDRMIFIFFLLLFFVLFFVFVFLFILFYLMFNLNRSSFI